MKAVTGSQLNRMSVGTVFAHLRHKNDEARFSSPGAMCQILTTQVDQETGESFIGRTDDGVLCTDAAYSLDIHDEFLPRVYNAPLSYCWGTSSAGCYDDDDIYVVLDNEDIERLIIKLRCREFTIDPQIPGYKALKIMEDRK